MTVPADYEANTMTSHSQIADAEYGIEETTTIVNCPIVPEGSTAELRLAEEDPGTVHSYGLNFLSYGNHISGQR